jgi:hypothetical protein
MTVIKNILKVTYLDNPVQSERSPDIFQREESPEALLERPRRVDKQSAHCPHLLFRHS